jgi:hypothetical protein
MVDQQSASVTHRTTSITITMKHSRSLHLAGLASCLALANSFHTFAGAHTHASKKTLSSSSFHWQMRASPSPDDTNPKRPDLVAQSTFIAANDVLYSDMAKSQGVEYVNQDKDDPNINYAIGRTWVTLSIPPQFELVETPELVLVKAVSKSAQDQGIQPLDTIVGVSAVDETFKRKTMNLNIEETAAILTAAIDHASNNGEEVITLELNRLMKGYYKPPLN